MTTDPTIVTQLNELMTTIGGYPDPRRASAEWKQVFRLLQKTDLPAGQVTNVAGMRDAAQLAEVIEQLGAPEAAAPPPDADAPDYDTCRKALRAFRKRLKLTRLDEESTLGHGPTSKGSGWSPTSMVPPTEWPQAVWVELVRLGKLRDVGNGFYELTKRDA